MENKDNLFNKIKSAADNKENDEFSSMEKIWSRIDAKLDTKIEKKHNNNWKKLFVAASVLLVGTIGFQLLNFEKNNSNTTQEKVVVIDTAKINSTESIANKEEIVAIDTLNPSIKKNADAILEEQISTKNIVAIEETNKIKEEKSISYETDEIEKPESKSLSNEASAAPSSSKWLGNRKFESRGVIQQNAEAIKESVAKDKQVVAAKKLEPLVVIDNKVSTLTKDELNKTELDSIIELKEPIYYINKVLYTEQELFGPNATSPYAPINKQDIETISILQPDKAKAIYGKKGEKGVVIITTKDGKPKPKKQ